MTAVLVIATTWIVLLAAAVGMLHVGTSAPTPRPAPATTRPLVVGGQGARSRPAPSDQSPSEVEVTPAEAA